MGYNRVITLVNGIRQEGQQWGDEHGIEIDDYSVGKVEIVKGPGSLMYGSDGIAGVLNFISQKAPSDGKIEIVLHWEDKGIGMIIQTTGRNYNETVAIAEILKEKFDR